MTKQYHHMLSLAYLLLITSSSLILPSLALPSSIPGSNRQARLSPVYQHSQQQQQQFQPEPLPYETQYQDQRKYAEKPNVSKKIMNDADLDLQTNSVQQEGFSWSAFISNILQTLFTPALNKSDNIDTDTGLAPVSPWTNIIAIGLKILTAFLGGGVSNGDGIDKVDNSSPLQGILTAVLAAVLGSKDPDQVSTMAKQAGEFINIVVNLLDALKTSFSQRSFKARSLGQSAPVSDAAIAGITLLKGYVRTLKTNEDICMQKHICDANRECTSDVKGIYCQLGTYAASYMFYAPSEFSKLHEAGRRGRSGDDCEAIYQSCNEV